MDAPALLGSVDPGFDADPLVLGGAALLAVGALVAGLAERLRTPSALLFLVVGMFVADDGLGWIEFSDAELAQSVAIVALVLILFEGGLSTSWRDARRFLPPAASLATVGTVVTGGVVALVAWWATDADRGTAFILGAVVASTDAAAVFGALRGMSLPGRVARMLEAESGLNDPVAVLLTVAALEVWRRDPSAAELAAFAVLEVAGGIAVGALAGAVAAIVLNRFEAGSAALYPVLALAFGGLAYGAAAAIHGSGLLATYLAGVVIGNRVDRPLRTIRVVHDGLAAAAQIGLFLLLGLLVFPSHLDEVALEGIVIALALVFVARPVAVVLSLAVFRIPLRELTFIAWAGLRGAVPIVLATMPLTAGHPDGQLIFDIVFFAVLGSVALQGTPLRALARMLRLAAEPGVSAAAIEFIPTDTPGADVAEVRLGPDAAVRGLPLRDAPMPGGARIAVIVRDHEVIVPTGDTTLDVDDLLVVAVPPHMNGATAALERWARRSAG